MQRIWPRTQQEQLDYHLKRNDTPNFTEGQPGRIDLARFLVDKIIRKDLGGGQRELRIVELGCGSADITGPYSFQRVVQLLGVRDKNLLDVAGGPSKIDVIGIDVVPQSAIAIQERFPYMTSIISPVEELDPIECDLLVMTEFLEHVHDPWAIVKTWMPKAHFAIIGHPLNEPNPPFEPGHIWSYTLDDWYAWFSETNHHVWERFLFPMGYWDNMVMGHGSRMDLPPWTA